MTKTARKRNAIKRDFGSDALIVPQIKWLHGHTEPEIATARTRFLLVAKTAFGPEEAASLAFDRCWAAVTRFMKSRGRSAFAIEKAFKGFGKKSPIIKAIKANIKSSQAVESLSPDEKIIWANMVAIAWNLLESNRLYPATILFIQRMFNQDRIYEAALRAYVNNNSGPSRDNQKLRLLRALESAWLEAFDLPATTSDKKGRFIHFLDLFLPLASHEIKVTLTADRRWPKLTGNPDLKPFKELVSADPRPVGNFTGDHSEIGDEHLSIVLNFQDECAAMSKQPRAEDGTRPRRHYLIGSMEAWLKKRKA